LSDFAVFFKLADKYPVQRGTRGFVEAKEESQDVLNGGKSIMGRRRIFSIVLVALAAGAWTGSLIAVSDEKEVPLFLTVDVGNDDLPERFTVAVGDVIVFHDFSCTQQPSAMVPVGVVVEPTPKPKPPRGDMTVRIQGEPGVLGDGSAIRFANFHGGKIQLDFGGLKGRSVKAAKAGVAKVEVTTHRGGTRREIRDFEITVVTTRKQEVSIMVPPEGLLLPGP
jgi:hypothetical protein